MKLPRERIPGVFLVPEIKNFKNRVDKLVITNYNTIQKDIQEILLNTYTTTQN